jgi:hypothetical protein
MTERSYSHVLATAREARVRFIGLTYDFPDGAPKELARLWNVADTAMLEFVRAVEAVAEIAEADGQTAAIERGANG